MRACSSARLALSDSLSSRCNSPANHLIVASGNPQPCRIDWSWSPVRQGKRDTHFLLLKYSSLDENLTIRFGTQNACFDIDSAVHLSSGRARVLSIPKSRLAGAELFMFLSACLHLFIWARFSLCYMAMMSARVFWRYIYGRLVPCFDIYK